LSGSRDGGRRISFFTRALADPVDDLLVARLAGGDALDEAGVGVGVRRPPCPAVGVENRAVSRNATRLLASGRGWFLVRC
jgi:hypothetical protein